MGTSRVLFGGFPDYLETTYAGVTLTSSPTASTGYPVSNLRERRLYKKARWAANTDITITWTYGGEIRDISAVVLADHNFPADSTVRVLLYADSVFTVGVTEPIYDSGQQLAAYSVSTDYVTSEVPEWGTFDWGGLPPADLVLSIPSSFIHPILQTDSGSGLQVPRHIQCGGGALIIEDTAPSGYSAAGMLMTTRLWQPSRNFRWNFRLGMVELGAAGTSDQLGRNGINWSRDFGRLRQMSMQLDLLNRSEILEFPWTFGFSRGGHWPLLVIPEPDYPEWWWAFAGLWRLQQTVGMEAVATAAKLWNLGGLQLLEWR
jgi:hypothetical protein